MKHGRLQWVAGALISLLYGAAGFAGTLELVTGADPGAISDTPSGGASHLASLSADGRYVAFTSEAVNVVPGQQDTNAAADVFLRDRAAQTTVLVSHADGSPGTAGNAPSFGLQISADGRYVLFMSTATNLVAGQIDTPNTFDLFLYDRVNGAVTLVSRSRASSHQAGNGPSPKGALSADGRWVVFESEATDLVNGQSDTNGRTDVFLYDRSAGSTILLSRSAGSANRTGDAESSLPGFPASLAISRDGSQILFLSSATDLLAGQTGDIHREKLYLYHRLNGTLSLVSHADGSATEAVGAWHEAAISADGNVVAFGSADGRFIYLYQRTSGAITQVTRTEHVGHSEMPNLSADGRYLAFISDAGDLAPGQDGQDFRTNVFLYDRVAGTFTLISRSLTSAQQPPSARSRVFSISADGRFVAYGSDYVDLVPGQVDTTAGGTEDLFLFDRSTGTSRLITHAADSDLRAVGGLDAPVALSSDGRSLAFADNDPSLVAGPRDLNREHDVLLYDTGTGGEEIVSRREGPPSLTGSFSRARAISSNGRYVLFSSDAPNLVPGQRDVNDPDAFIQDARLDVFLYDRVSKARTLVSHAATSPATTGNGGSRPLAMSPDGRWTVFISQATDLVPGQSDDNGGADLFLFDRSNGAITLVSHRAGSPATTGHGIGYAGTVARVSADGRFVAFVSSADDLVPGQTANGGLSNLFLFDRVSGEIQLVTHEAGSPTTPTGSLIEVGDLTPDGRFLTFSSDSTHLVPGQTGSGLPSLNVFLYDRTTGSSALVSHAPAMPTHVGGGGTAQSRISADGLFVAFEGEATDASSGGPFRAIYLLDRLTDRVTFITFGERVEGISADGRTVAFSSSYTQVIPGQVDNGTTNDVFLYDRISGVITLVSHAAGKPTTAANQYSFMSGLSADGNAVAFWSPATNVVPGFVAPQPSHANVYLFNRVTGTSQLISGMLGSAVRPANSDSFSTYSGVLSADGRSLAFESQATDLVPGIFYASRDVYLYRADGAPSGPVTLPPCNLFTGSLRSNARKVVTVAGACGVPAGARQGVVKITVSQGTGKGNVQLYPGNVTNPSSGILRFTRGAARSASFTIPLGNGGIALLPFVAGNGTVRVMVEVDGYVP